MYDVIAKDLDIGKAQALVIVMSRLGVEGEIKNSPIIEATPEQSEHYKKLNEILELNEEVQ